MSTFKVDDAAIDIEFDCPLEKASFAKGPNSAWTLLHASVDRILKQRRGQPAFADEFSQLESMTTGAATLVPCMQEWVTQVRIAEGFLSEAQVTSASKLVEGSHNWQVSMIAKQNEVHGVSTERASMQQIWYYRIEHDFRTKIAPHLRADIERPEYFYPCFMKEEDGSPKYQVLAYKPYPDLPDVHCGVVLEVYRGVAVKLKDVPDEILDLLAYFFNIVE